VYLFSECQANIDILRFVVEILTRCLGRSFIVKQKKCQKLLPYAGGVLLFFLLVFAIWVRSVPPKPVAPVVDPLNVNNTGGVGSPEFMKADAQLNMKEGLTEARANADAEAAAAAEKATPEGETGADAAKETNEL
jgi:cytoskeletal protein RodZ